MTEGKSVAPFIWIALITKQQNVLSRAPVDSKAGAGGKVNGHVKVHVKVMTKVMAKVMTMKRVRVRVRVELEVEVYVSVTAKALKFWFSKIEKGSSNLG